MLPAAPLPPVFCAIDTTASARARALAAAVATAGAGVKLGLEFFNAHGPAGVAAVMADSPGAPLFLDLKYHDIPNTVAGAVRAAVRLRPAYLNVHAQGGAAMMRAARDAAREEAARLGITPPHLLAVTILTSMDDETLSETGLPPPVAARVAQLAALTQASGLDGVVCSAHEVAALRAACGPDFILMVPGIRPEGHSAGSDDQKRIMTPAQAMAAGATHLVIGRPITAQDDPRAAARAILDGLAAPCAAAARGTRPAS